VTTLRPDLNPAALQTIPLIFQLNCRTLNVSVDTEFPAQYHSRAFGLTVKAGAYKVRISVLNMSQAAAAIPQKLFFKIGEVCELAGVQAHVLRYWETEFPMLTPQKNRAGQRTYRRRDVEMALRIKELLYDEQYTIAGAKKKLAGEIRGVGRETSDAPAAKAPVRSLKPPPSLAARFSSAAAPAPAPTPDPVRAPVSPAPEFTSEQRASLKQIAAQLQDILDLLDDGDKALAALRSHDEN